MNKYGVINTLDFRLAMMGFSHPDSTKKNEYYNANGDKLVYSFECQYGAVSWCWFVRGALYSASFSKRSIVSTMESSGLYAQYGGSQ